MADKFSFKQFDVWQDKCAMKVGTDGVLLGAWAEGGKHMLDVGCGTGLISLMLAQRYPDASITALDIDAECVKQTIENVDRVGWNNRVEAVCNSLQEFAKHATAPCYDAIVSNPPFFLNSLKNPDARRTMARHADSLPFRELAQAAFCLLKDSGTFSLILPHECFNDFSIEATLSGFYLVEDVSIITKTGKPIKRHLLRFSKSKPEQLLRSTVMLQNENGTRSSWYHELTKDFYL